MSLIKRLSKRKKEKEPEYILSEDAAENQLFGFIDYYDLDLENMIQNEQGSEMLEAAYSSIVKRIRQGILSIEKNEAGTPIVKQKLKSGEILEYGEPSAESTLMKSKYKDEDNRTLGVLSALCGKSKKFIEELKGQDRMTAFRVSTLFLPVV